MQGEAAAWRSDPIDPAALPGLRRRTLWTLFAGVALGSTGYITAISAGTLVAAELGGGVALSGLPGAVAVLGTASGTVLLSAVMVRRGRRPGIIAGLTLGTIGGIAALLGVISASFLLFLVGSYLAGFGNGATQLARYVAADLALPARRASVIGTVVWGSTIGAVIGPNLIAPGSALADKLGLPPLAGAYLLTLGFSAVAVSLAFVLLRPEPYRLAHESAFETQPAGVAATSSWTLLARPAVLVALVTLVAGQVVMTLIMTMTPLHILDHGHGLETVGLVLSAHTFGMYALSPVSGRLTDRYGSPAVIGAGLATLGTGALLAAAAPADGGVLLTFALFLLGYGWNLGYVAGSALLTRGLDLSERTRAQGVVDGLTWSSAAVASLASGLVVASASYAALGALGIGLLVIPAAVLLLRGRRAVAVPSR